MKALVLDLSEELVRFGPWKAILYSMGVRKHLKESLRISRLKLNCNAISDQQCLNDYHFVKKTSSFLPQWLDVQVLVRGMAISMMHGRELDSSYNVSQAGCGGLKSKNIRNVHRPDQWEFLGDSLEVFQHVWIPLSVKWWSTGSNSSTLCKRNPCGLFSSSPACFVHWLHKD